MSFSGKETAATQAPNEQMEFLSYHDSVCIRRQVFMERFPAKRSN